MTEMLEIVKCPEQDCDSPAEVVDRWYADGSPIPVEMVTLRCVSRHSFCGAADGFDL